MLNPDIREPLSTGEPVVAGTNDALSAAYGALASSNAQARLAARGRRQTYRKGAILINEGEISDGVYIILSGSVNVYSMDEEARDIIFATLGAGDYFGEMSLDGGPRSASVITLERTECAVLSKAQVVQYMTENPHFAQELLLTVIRRAREATRIARALALQDVTSRLRDFLEREATVSPDGSRALPGRMTQQDIAARIGCGREMVSRAMAELKRRGVTVCRAG
ncbi:MAG: Crp/Fnr family transcriptional regulator [Burkholderiales bacterium]|nr:Crp/Fnr family transcriptional regulator [Burkholderiales bacterium]